MLCPIKVGRWQQGLVIVGFQLECPSPWQMTEPWHACEGHNNFSQGFICHGPLMGNEGIKVLML